MNTSLLARIESEVRPAEGRIPAFVYAHPEIYELELARVFARSWLFLAHESEVANPGDYVTRFLADEEVIVARGEDERIRVLRNVCRHRGMKMCRAEMGNSSHFRCPYHGFTYRNNGQLVGVPFRKEAYGDVLDTSAMALLPVRSESYQGLIFGTVDERAPDLGSYLGPVAWYLDLLAGRAEMEVIGPPHVWTVPMSWKLGAENFLADSYHTAYAHASISKIGLTSTVDFGKQGFQIDAGGGHGLGLGVQDSGSIFPAALRDAYAARLSPDQLVMLDRVKNMHGTVFPNFSFLIPTPARFRGHEVTSTSIRLWRPDGPDRIVVYSWCLIEKDAPDEWRDLSSAHYIYTFGPAGVLEQDDDENLSSITAASSAWSVRQGDVAFNYQMGLQRTPVADFAGPGTAFDVKYTEHNARRFYEHWRELMLQGGDT